MIKKYEMVFEIHQNQNLVSSDKSVLRYTSELRIEGRELNTP